MKRLIAYLTCLSVIINTMAQVNVTGKIIDKENDEPLTGASVIVKGADGKIKKFASSKSDGGFSWRSSSWLPSGSYHDELRQAVYSA